MPSSVCTRTMNASCIASAAVTSIDGFSTPIASMSVIFTRKRAYSVYDYRFMGSHLRHSERLGRRIRTGDAASLGVPTEELALEALAAGDVDLAREYIDYSIEETDRVRTL